MKKWFVVACCLWPLLNAWAGQQEICALKNTAFKAGEQLRYSAYFQWGALIVDRLSLNTSIKSGKYHNEDVYSIEAVAQTEKTMHTFFALCDSFRSEIRKSDMFGLYYYEHDKERKYEAIKHHSFYPIHEGMVLEASEWHNGTPEKKEYICHNSCPMDALSLLFRIRNYDFNNFKEGESQCFAYGDLNGVSELSLIYVGKEQIKLRNGAVYNCLRFHFTAVDGTLFSKDNPVSIWLSDDDNHLIVHAEAKLKIGYAKMDLEEVKGNRHPLSAQTKTKK